MPTHKRVMLREIVTYVSGAAILAVLGGAVSVYNTTQASAARLDSLESNGVIRADQLQKIESTLTEQHADIATIKANVDWLVNFTRSKWEKQADADRH